MVTRVVDSSVWYLPPDGNSLILPMGNRHQIDVKKSLHLYVKVLSRNTNNDMQNLYSTLYNLNKSTLQYLMKTVNGYIIKRRELN